MLKKIKNDINEYKLVIIILLIYIITMEIMFKELCPIKILFGANCPGCGLTHATISLLKGNLVEAFNYNYSIFFITIAVAIFIIDRYIYKFKLKIVPALFIISAFIMIFRYLLLFIA